MLVPEQELFRPRKSPCGNDPFVPCLSDRDFPLTGVMGDEFVGTNPRTRSKHVRESVPRKHR